MSRAIVALVLSMAIPLALGCGSGTISGLCGGDDDDDTGDDDTGDDDTVGNTPPSAPGVAIYPEQPSAADELTCEIVQLSEDMDGDAISYAYAWSVNQNPTNITSPAVPSDYTSTGDDWTCAVTPSDGQVDGPDGTASVVVGSSEYELVQELDGVTAADPCPDCEFTFDITYTTVSETGSCGALCGFTFPDGVHTFGYSDPYQGVMIYFSYYEYAGWYVWYYAEFDGTHLDFWWNGHGYTQGGYWDVAGDTMTGLAINSEP